MTDAPAPSGGVSRLQTGGLADVALFVAAAVAISAIILVNTMGQMKPDLAALYYAGEFFYQGLHQEVYWDSWSLQPVSWQNAVAEDGLSGTYYAFIYPPVWAALIAPIAGAMEPRAFFDLFVIANQVLFCGMLVMAWRMFRRPMPLSFWAIPVLAVMPMTLFGASLINYGQPTGLVFFLILWGCERFAAGRYRTAGVLLALATTIKIFPVLLGAVFLHRARLGGLATFVATGAAMVALSFALAPAALHWEFIALGREFGGLTSISFLNLNLEAFLTRAGMILQGQPIEGVYSVPERGWVTVINAVANLALVGWIVLRWRDLPGRAGARELSVSVLLVALLAPIAWTHYFVVALALLPALFVLVPARLALLLVVPFVLTNLVEAYVGLGPVTYPMLASLSLVAFAIALLRAGRAEG